MANPTPTVIDWIRAQDPDWTRRNDEIATDLNGRTVPNPVPQTTLPRPFAIADLKAILDTPALGKLQALPSLPRLLDMITTQNRDGLALWADLLTAGGTITGTQRATILGRLAETEPDPAWLPEVPRAVLDLGRTLDAADVAAARPESETP